MKKRLLAFFISLLLVSAGYAQLSGIKTIPGDYASLRLAIADLNTQGVASPGVTFNVAANLKETFLNPADGHITTLTGSITSPITFQKSGPGANPIITAAIGTGSMDAIFAVAGSDYVTFDGFTLVENDKNLEETAWMEWGFAILKASGANGSQHITIKNCSITLEKYNPATIGIYSNNHTLNSVTPLTVTSVEGANSNIKVFGNTIANSYMGIYFKGFEDSSPYSLYDQNNEIGKDGANIITNVGGGDFVAYGIYTIYQNNLKVANNTLNSTSEGSKTLYGIYLTTANNASFDLYGNTITLNYTTTDPYGNSHFYPLYCDMGANGISNVANIYNNTVTNCTYPASPSQSATRCMFLMNMGVTANVYGNVVSNNTIGGDGLSATIGEIRYFWCQKVSLTPGALVVHDNSITGNARIQPMLAGGSTYYLTIAGSGTTLDAYNNLIDNNVVCANGATNCLYITFADAILKEVHHNTVTNISEANGSIAGLYNGGGTLGLVHSNMIRGINAAYNAENSTISGIVHGGGASPGLNMYYYNNFISELSNPGTSGSLGYSYNRLNGIYCEGGTTVKGFYNNSVYLNSPAYVNDFGSSAFCAENLTNVDLRNNIFVNVSASTGLGKTVCIRSRNTSFAGYTSNYNDIYAGTPGPSNLIFYNGTLGFETLAAYQTQVTPNEMQSVTELPPFVNITTSPYNLHLSTTIPTKCEGSGVVMSTPVSIPIDYDGTPRFPNPGYPVNGAFIPTGPDLGADEFGGIPIDNNAPSIVYTPLLSINNGNPRTLLASITDASGVPVSGFGLPVLYWRKNTEPYVGVQGVYQGTGTYSFTFGGGVVLNDVVNYYIVAQDSKSPIPNVGAYPWLGAAGFSANPPTCITPPSNPSSYSIILDISGVKHVGVGKEYTTLTAAAADLNAKYMAGPVTFILDDNTYPAETFPIKFNNRPGNSVVNTLTIKPNTNANPVISGSKPSQGIIVLNGIDHVTIDGSNNGTNSKNLLIENTSNAGNSHVIGISNNNGTDPSKFVTIRNCTLRAEKSYEWGPLGNDLGIYLIVINANGGLNGGGYDNCVIENNTLLKARCGIDISATAGNINRNITITGNTIGSPDTTYCIQRYGIAVSNSDNTLIADNDIMGHSVGTQLANMFGIIYYDNCSNTKIHRNKIHDWVTFQLHSVGIKCSNNNNTTPTEIFNNLIYNIVTPGMNPGPSNNNAYGIFVRLGSNIKIWHNTINLSGPNLNGTDSYAPSSACICTYTSASNELDIRNNILRNSMTNPANPLPGSGNTGRAYAIQHSGNATAFSTLDYNDYYADGYNGTIAQVWIPGFGPVDEFETLPEWQTYTGKDANSLNLNPVFASDTTPLNLHPTNLNLNSVGGPKLLDTDLDNSTRYTPTDMGAFEWSALMTDYHTLAATAVDQTIATLNGDINTNGEVAELYFDYGATTSYGTTVAASPATVRSVGSLFPVSAAITGLLPNTTYHFRFWGIPTTSGQSNFYGGDMTFTTTGVPVNTTVTNSYSNDTCFNATSTITVAGTPNTFVVLPTGHVTMIAGEKILLLPGTVVQPGGYLHAYISNQYCVQTKTPFMASKMAVEENSPVTVKSNLKVYPNPTSGEFTVEISGSTEKGEITVEIFSMHGEKILATTQSEQSNFGLSLAGMPAGIYIIRVIGGSSPVTTRIIKQ